MPGSSVTRRVVSCVYRGSLTGIPARVWLGSILLFLSLGALAGEDVSEDVWQLLQKMVVAGSRLNYDGTFVYRKGNELETMRIIHRSGQDGEKERLVSLNGSAREVVRDEKRVTCIQPDDQSVVVESARGQGAPGSIFRNSDRRFSQYYQLVAHAEDRVAGRPTRIVAINAKDQYRYGYQLWLDKETGLLLKSELRNQQGEALEQFLYTSISLPESIPDSLLRPAITSKAFQVFTGNASDPEPQLSGDGRAWHAAWLPVGFSLSRHVVDTMPNSDQPVEHMLYSDGLASFSVYIEPLDPDSENGRFEGGTRMGAMNAFGTVQAGHQITVVGAVPEVTVHRVAQALDLRP